ncbi:hypothetical protein J6590_073039 [Homalodisca vitripennis]|nr:hypothetical protein J6590_073039 [Homalodisca vitripennis]
MSDQRSKSDPDRDELGTGREGVMCNVGNQLICVMTSSRRNYRNVQSAVIKRYNHSAAVIGHSVIAGARASSSPSLYSSHSGTSSGYVNATGFFIQKLLISETLALRRGNSFVRQGLFLLVPRSVAKSAPRNFNVPVFKCLLPLLTEAHTPQRLPAHYVLCRMQLTPSLIIPRPASEEDRLLVTMQQSTRYHINRLADFQPITCLFRLKFSTLDHLNCGSCRYQH